MEKRPFFRADMAGLGKYHTGGFGRIGVYRVNVEKGPTVLHEPRPQPVVSSTRGRLRQVFM